MLPNSFGSLKKRHGGASMPSNDPLMDVALEAARLLTLALETMRGEPEPGFANKVENTVQRIYAIEAARIHGS